MTDIDYKGHSITIGIYSDYDVTVQYCGDEIYFNTLEEAQEFIDEMEAKE